MTSVTHAQTSLPVEPAGDVFVVVVTGSRFHADADLIGTALYETIAGAGARRVVVRHGACPRGADLITHDFVDAETPAFAAEGVLLVEDAMPAVWDLCGSGCPDEPHRRIKKPGDIFHPGELADYCPVAGPRRNTAMAVKTPVPDVCAAFPLGRSYGTWNCMKAARDAGIPVRPFPARGEAA